MATLYFNAAADDDWSNLLNWWTDAAFTVQASSLPGSADDVILTETVNTNSGSPPTVNTLTAVSSAYLGVSLTGNCTFNDYSQNSYAITGDCTFNDSSQNNGGSITGNCTFNDYSQNSYVITGNCTFSDYATNYGPITGDCTFNDYAFCSGLYSSVSGLATFNDYSTCDSCPSLNDAVFNGVSHCVWTNVYGDATFNDSAYLVEGGNVLFDGNVTFNDSSYYAYNSGAQESPITFNGTVGFANRTPYPIPRGINGSSILGVL